MTVSVSYKSNQLLGCADCNANAVIICVDPSLVLSGAPYVEGTLEGYTCAENCGEKTYNYTLNYDENQLVNTNYRISRANIKGVICRGCLTSYIDWITSQENGFAPMSNGIQQWSSPIPPQVDNTAAITALGALDNSGLSAGALAYVLVNGIPSWFAYNGLVWIFKI